MNEGQHAIWSTCWKWHIHAPSWLDEEAIVALLQHFISVEAGTTAAAWALNPLCDGAISLSMLVFAAVGY